MTNICSVSLSWNKILYTSYPLAMLWINWIQTNPLSSVVIVCLHMSSWVGVYAHGCRETCIYSSWHSVQALGLLFIVLEAGKVDLANSQPSVL